MGERQNLEHIIRMKGITKRWIFSVLGVVFLIVVFTACVFSFMIKNLQYDSVRRELYSRVSMSSGFFSKLGTAGESEFELNAKEFANNFADKNMMEVQLFDRNDNMIVSSRGFLPNVQEYTDYKSAKQNDDNKAEWIGETAGGEKVMAVTSILPEVRGVSPGATRFVVSLEQVDRQIFNNIMLIVGIGFLFLLFAMIPGLLFLDSIIKPVKAITAIAYKIASGDFEARLPVREDDEIGKLCDTINYMAAELSSTENVKNEFISSVSHELRTPLTVIKGWGETVRDSAEADPELVEKGMSVIISEAERLSGLVEDLLDFSQMQSGRLSLKMQKIDILAELSEAVYMFKQSANDAGVEITYLEPETVPPVMADPSRLRQVFINVLDNAVKYSNQGGHILVEVSQHDVYVSVMIKDTGCGIAPEDLSKVKERFYKANKTVRGSGIGLAVADEILKQHNGIFEIDSIEGAGTTVHIVLPIIVQEESDRGEEIE